VNRQQLFEHIRKKKSFLCVGLDTDIRLIPDFLREATDPLFAFNRQIIDAVQQYCVAFKPNLAFYESLGAEGWTSLEKTVHYIRRQYPEQFIIADAKRGDIGNTASLYARAFFEQTDFDAVTVAPYMGEDSVKPFTAYVDHWVVLLALTSNKSAGDFQFLTTGDGKPLYEHVLTASQKWAPSDQMMYVVGATQASKLQDIRRIVPDHFLLVPGIGAQGGSLQDVANFGFNKQCGLLVNASRSIIYASRETDFAGKATAAAYALQQDMEMLLYEHKLI
jgi:orotidine-5'-phosphate decarboxylase